MARYINLDNLIKGLNDTLKDKDQKDFAYKIFKVFIGRLDKEPTADVVEVKHGEWETIPDYSRSLVAYRHLCSVCGCFYKDIRPNGHEYCHECGAKMDGERKP